MRTLSSLAIAAVVLLAACSSTKLDDNAPVEANPAATSSSTGSTSTDGVDSRTVNTVNAGGAANSPNDPLNDPRGILAKRSIYFDYDSYSVKEEFRSVVEAHAKYLNANKGRKVIIQGNTDERGGTEYNLALGQKRAEAVRRALVLLGVANTQLEAISFGKEKPKAQGSDEAAWTENRRADLAYQ